MGWPESIALGILILILWAVLQQRGKCWREIKKRTKSEKFRKPRKHIVGFNHWEKFDER